MLNMLCGMQQWSGFNAVSFFAPQIFAGSDFHVCLQLSECLERPILLLSLHSLLWLVVKSSGICAGVTAFSKGGNEGSLYAALLVNGVQWIATIITVISVDKAGPDSPSHSHILLPLISPQHAMPCTAGACYWQNALLPSDTGLTVGSLC